MKSPRANRFCGGALALLLSSFFVACGGGYSGGGGGNPPATPTGLTAFVGNQQVLLNWNASTGATSYNVSRSTTTGGPYTKIASAALATYTDQGLTNGTTYYYVVAAVNAYGASANSKEVPATPAVPATAVNATVDVLANRHAISPYVYGGAYLGD